MIVQIVSSIIGMFVQGVSFLGFLFELSQYAVKIGALVVFLIVSLKKFYSMTYELENLKGQQHTKQDVQVYRKLFSQERNIIYLLILFFTATYTFFHFFSLLPWLENYIILPFIFSYVMVNMKKHAQSYPNALLYIPLCQGVAFFLLYHFIRASFKAICYLQDIVV